MTGAGSATVAYALEQSYMGSLVDSDSDGSPDWIQPGMDITVGDLTVEQALERSRHPDDPTPAGSREGNFEGALSVSFSMTDDNFHDLIFADGGTALPTSPMRAPSSTWYCAAEMPDGTTETRTPTGAIVPDATISYEQGSDITVELTLLYGDEPSDVTAPSTVQKPSDADVFSWHGATFKVDTLNQPLMQSTTLSLSGLARFRRGQDRHPYDAVVDAIEPSFSTDATFTERDQLAAAVDNSRDGPVGKVPATLSFANGQGTTIEYSLTDCQPASYSWADLVAANADLSEPIDYHVTDVSATTTTA
ncbi:phage tail tube protein [Natrinema halophilum]|uniref:phage tail tube protein n=1 Tax=Natrinema halophilum TaxID=1699371 RepID=UPI001F3DBF8D|nr:phage tail tube protein [Natrinema halophilum]UHQ96465.1 phage tail tube protein [Natrinema halophilum]